MLDPPSSAPDPQLTAQRQEQHAETAKLNFQIGKLIRRMEKIMHTLDETLGVVTAQQTTIASLSALMAGMKKQIDDALGGQLTPSQQMRVDAIFNQAETNKEAIDAAIKANAGDVAIGTGFATRVLLTSSATPANIGDSVVLRAALDAHPDSPPDLVPTGTMSFQDAGTEIGSGTLAADGTASFSTTSLTAGDHTITAVYSGDKSFSTSTSAPLTQTIGTQPVPQQLQPQQQPVTDPVTGQVIQPLTPAAAAAVAAKPVV